MNNILNELAKMCADKLTQQVLETVRAQQFDRENDGLHKYVRIGNGNNKLWLLCQTDKNGKLLPKELARIRKVKKTLNIKE